MAVGRKGGISGVKSVAQTFTKSDKADTLVVYVHDSTDPEYERNLQFFVRYGIKRGDGCDYLIVVQQAGL